MATNHEPAAGGRNRGEPKTKITDQNEAGQAARSYLVRVVDLLGDAGSARDAVVSAARESARFCGAEFASVYLYHDERDLSGFLNAGLPPGMAADVEKLGRTQWIADFLTTSGYPLLSATSHGPGAAYDSPLHKLAQAQGLDAILSVPLEQGGQLRGLMLLFFDGYPNLSEDHIDSLYVMAGHAALTLANAELIDTRRWEHMAQEQFLDMLSHELRTPLTSIMGFTQIIRRRVASGSEIDNRLRDQLNMLWAQAQRLSRLLDTFVDISTIDRGDFSIAHDPLDITFLLRSALEQSQAQARSKHAVSTEIPQGPIWVHGDMKRLAHVFSHVISNALRYTPEDKNVLVVCEEDAQNKEVRISVIDKGPGIPPELRRELFKRFYPTDSRRSGGLGIGLYVSRAIIEAHGGRLALQSQSGEGTSVVIHIPLG